MVKGTLRDAVRFSGLNFVATQLDAATDTIVHHDFQQGEAFHLVNAYTLALADKDSKLHQVLRSGTLFADGAPLARYLRRKSSHIGQVRGPSFMRECLLNSNANMKHFLLGADAVTLESLCAQIKAQFTAANVVGCYSPAFHADWMHDMKLSMEEIRQSKANIVWVGLGTPKQDFVVDYLARELGVVAIGVGAAFDYIAGTRKEAPKFIQGSGLEWFYRLLLEPRRLIGRYSAGNLRFIWMVLRDFVKK